MNFVSSATVVRVIEHSADIREYEFSVDKFRKFDAGSFLQLTLEHVTPSEIWPDSRTFSIASYGTDNMRLIIQKVGYYTTRIFNELLVGTKCTIKYPFGELFDKRSADENHVFVAGGLGITPYLSLLEYFKYAEKLSNVSMLYSVKHKEDFLYHQKIMDYLDDRAKFFVTREVTEEYPNRRITLQDIVDLSISHKDSHYYICGSKDFNEYYKNGLHDLGYTHIHMDEWA